MNERMKFPLSEDRRKEHIRAIIEWCLAPTTVWFDVWSERNECETYADFSVNLIATHAHLLCLDTDTIDTPEIHVQIQKFHDLYAKANPALLIDKALERFDLIRWQQRFEELYVPPMISFPDSSCIPEDDQIEEDFVCEFEIVNLMREICEWSFIYADAGYEARFDFSTRLFRLGRAIADAEIKVEERFGDLDSGFHWLSSFVAAYRSTDELVKDDKTRRFAPTVERWQTWLDTYFFNRRSTEMDFPVLVPLCELARIISTERPTEDRIKENESQELAAAKIVDFIPNQNFSISQLQRLFNDTEFTVSECECRLIATIVERYHGSPVLSISVRVPYTDECTHELDGWRFCIQGDSFDEGYEIDDGCVEIPTIDIDVSKLKTGLYDLNGNFHPVWCIVG